MSWYSRFLIFVITPIVVALTVYGIVDTFRNSQGDGNVPIRAVQDR